MLERAPSPAAARQRRYRRRQRNGETIVTVALSPEETDKLYRLRCLDAHQLEDRAAIADAIHLLLANISGV
jgi:hypothetical protein